MRYEFLIESYETERIKVVSVWSEFRDEDLPEGAELRRRHVRVQAARLVAVLLPRLAVERHLLLQCGSRAEADEVEAVPRGVRDARRVVRRVPERRIGLLHRPDLDRAGRGQDFRRGLGRPLQDLVTWGGMRPVWKPSDYGSGASSFNAALADKDAPQAGGSA